MQTTMKGFHLLTLPVELRNKIYDEMNTFDRQKLLQATRNYNTIISSEIKPIVDRDGLEDAVSFLQHSLRGLEEEMMQKIEEENAYEQLGGYGQQGILELSAIQEEIDQERRLLSQAVKDLKNADEKVIKY